MNKRRSSIWLCLSILGMPLYTAQYTSAQSFDADFLKAIYIEKFTHSIGWGDMSETPNPCKICIIGDSDVASYLKLINQYVKHENITNIEVSKSMNAALDSTIHIVFISEEKNQMFEKIFDVCKAKPILIITESPGMARKGAHINYFIDPDNTLHFNINEKSFKQSKLKLDYMLLEVVSSIY